MKNKRGKESIRNESTFLDAVAGTYVDGIGSPWRKARKLAAIRLFSGFLRPSDVILEMGCGDGFMTRNIAKRVGRVEVIDGSKKQVAKAAKHAPDNVTFEHTLFEKYQPTESFDGIFMCHILEHVLNPVSILKRAKEWVGDRGHIYIVVPNARAQSRQLAQHLDLLPSIYDLTDNDRNHGHRRVYDRQQLSRHIAQAGLTERAQGGLMMKPFADFQMDALFAAGVLNETHVEGLFRMGLEFPDSAGYLFSVCSQ